MQMRYFRKIFLLVFAIALIYTTGIPALAAQTVPDMDRTGSVSVTMRDPDTKKAVSGGMLTLYQVGKVQVEGGDYSFALTDAFSGSDLALADVESADLAEDLAKYAKDKKLTGTEIVIGKNGTAVCTGLALGVYLVVQTKNADGYYAVNPFLVTIPVMDGKGYIYDVDSTPKMSLVSEMPEEENPQQPSVPRDKTLPQTGQLNWPVPVLTVLGLLIFAIGWMLCLGDKRKNR